MKKYLYLFGLILAGCNYFHQPPIPTTTPPNQIKTVKQMEQMPNKEKSDATQILYYYVPDSSMAQALSGIYGTFLWRNGCIYLLQVDKYKPSQITVLSALFPELPKNSVIWNEEAKTLTLLNRDDPPKAFEFKMGESIKTNGRTGDFSSEQLRIGNDEYHRCHSPDGFAMIGTIDIEKLEF
ncbi:hypothetical protein [Moraxella marmotae]|uniref:hypothetical protein n=1 Tax=Moraxella marmotae TaxID=3344520 RepID=UPI0035F2B115